MARGSFKQKRGGGRSFSKHLTLDENGTAVSTDKWGHREKDSDDDDDSDEEEKEEEEEEESEEEEAAAGSNQPELSRAERKELKKKRAETKKAQEEADLEDGQDPLLANPNVVVSKKLAIADLGAPRQLSRREREEKEKKDAKERYWKLHEQGKTDEAKADLARLAKIRAEREAAQAKRKAEAEAKTAEIDAKRKEAMAKGKRI